MKTNLLLIVLLGLSELVGVCNAQVVETKPKLDASKSSGTASKSSEFTIQCVGEINPPPSADLKWRPTLVNRCFKKEHHGPDYELIQKQKQEKLLMKQQSVNKNSYSEPSIQAVTPVVGTNYLGNTNNGGSPMDNSMAISNGNWIVSVANTTIEYDDINGNTIYFDDIVTFLNDPNITNVCDPVVIYDAGVDRFIFFAQECAGNSANSYLLICFSKTNNPQNGWWYYKLTGNPLNDGSWFDYPKVAVSTNELYITGNLYDNSSNYNQSILYQIEKGNGYSGGSLNWQYWYNITGNPFTLCPLSYGHGGSYGPGCYLVASSSGGGSTIKLYDLTDDMSASNEQLNYYSVSTTTYSTAPDAYQLGTSVLLDNGDCRMLGGFYLNQTAHFVFHSEYNSSAYNGLNYNRLNVSALTNQSSVFGLSGYDYSYPTVVSYATTTTDKSVMIGFHRSGSSIYPEQRVVNCDNAMNWSGSTQVKAGLTYVDQYQQNGVTRWGDYSGSSRKHNQAPIIWMTGSYGATGNYFNAWNAEIYDLTVGVTENPTQNNNVNIFPNPVVEMFSVEFLLDNPAEIEIGIIDVNGKVVKELYAGKANPGTNVFSFNKANLSSGTYFLTIKNKSNIIKNEKIIIAD